MFNWILDRISRRNRELRAENEYYISLINESANLVKKYRSEAVSAQDRLFASQRTIAELKYQLTAERLARRTEKDA